MKKTLSFLLALILLCSALPALAETAETEEETGSKFEQVLLKKGTLIVKEFIDCCLFAKDSYYDNNSLKEFSDTLSFQTASVLDVKSGIKVYALRIVGYYYNSQYDSGEAVGVMDADEIDAAIQTLEYIKQHINELKDYSEIIYEANSGVEIGAYYSEKDKRLFIKINSKATKYYGTDKIDELIQALTLVKGTFGN